MLYLCAKLGIVYPLKYNILKKLFIILLASILVSTSLFAQFRSETGKGDILRTYGPIKQITTIVYADGEETGRDVCRFDSIGIVESYWINEDGRISERSRRNYHYIDSNSCWCYYHMNLGDVRGPDSDEDTIKYFFNDKGETMKSYDKNSCLIDSFVYDAQGRLIEQYERNGKKMELLYKYTYDRLGRLIKEQNFEPYRKYVVTYQYQPSGNYKKYHIRSGSKHVMKGFVNNKGQLIKLENNESEVIYKDYDKYGNWLKIELKPTRPDSKISHMVYERIIEYFE